MQMRARSDLHLMIMRNAVTVVSGLQGDGEYTMNILLEAPTGVISWGEGKDAKSMEVPPLLTLTRGRQIRTRDDFYWVALKWYELTVDMAHNIQRPDSYCGVPPGQLR